MANADYIDNAAVYGFCPVARIVAAVPLEVGPTNVVISALSATIPNPIRAGMAAMIGDEIVSVLSVSGLNLTLGRGCADTVPASHGSNSVIFFFDDSLATNEVEYLPTETISLKPLPRTSTAVVPLESSPPLEVHFDQRFARPYPPGNYRIDDIPWFTPFVFNIGNPGVVLTWAHRNRITQADMLVPHNVGSIAPEAGVTYTIDVHRASDDAMLASYPGITAETFTYDWTQAIADFGGEMPGTQAGYLILRSVRGGLYSFQRYRTNFSFSSAGQPYGLGYRLGQYLGGFPP